VTVTDTGPGIPQADRERVLQRFVRLDATRSTPGNGLGLSLVDAVAKLHRAELSLADNRPGLRISLAFRTSPDEGVKAIVDLASARRTRERAAPVAARADV
jgi:signal transduction histidine kinase